MRGLSALLLIVLMVGASAYVSAGAPAEQQAVSETDELRVPYDRYAFPREGIIVQAAVPPRPIQPKHVGSAGKAVDVDYPPTAAPPASAPRLDAQQILAGQPETHAWRSRAPPVFAA